MQRHITVLTALALLSFAGAPGYSQDSKPRKRADDYKLQIAPFVGYRFGGTFEDKDTDEDFDLDNDSSVGLIVNFPSKNNTEWEIYYSRQSTEVNTGDIFQSTSIVDIDVEYLQIGGTYLFDRVNETQPYFVATAGIARFDPDRAGTRSDEFFSFGVGGGYKWFPDNRFGLRLDGRFLGTLIDSDSDIFCTSGPDGGQCLISTRGDILWQFELQAGFIVRF